ncbi:MAG: hypothetical protein GYA63_06820 [Armatimonadetes bacterium]|nr:hypothetical protein [Armatimonadota bacterium]HOC30895.1 hypothetical protein [Armatimonadota bacterium]
MNKKGVLLGFIFMIGACLPATAVWGDGDGNGTFDYADLARALRISGGLLKATATDINAMDVEPDSLDGRVTIRDAVRLARVLTGLDQQRGVAPIPGVFTVTVSGSSFSQALALAGGYVVAGTVSATGEAIMPNYMRLYNKTTNEFVAWTPVSSAGAFSAAGPAGSYQLISETVVSSQSPYFENIDIGYNTQLGTPFAVYSDVTGLKVTQVRLPATASLTLDFSVPPTVFFLPRSVMMRESTVMGRTWVNREVSTTPVQTAVPKTTYRVTANGDLGLSTSLTESFSMEYDTTITVSGTTSKSLAIPTVAELGGTITAPSALTLTGVTAYGASTLGAWSAWTPDITLEGGFLVAGPPGKLTLSIAANHGTWTGTGVDYLVPVTLSSGGTTKNVTLPSLPSFALVTLTVRRPTGGVLPAAAVTAISRITTLPTSGVYSFSASGITDENGQVVFRLPAGTYDISVVP